jgi:molybdenum cofactor synthesis domain-containing protein
MTQQPTAAIVVIGNEILSGKTLDANIQYLAQELARLGIVLVEARVIRDDRAMIIEYVRQCSRAYDYVFTTGGIGPTHDDITAEAVAAACGDELVLNEDAAVRIGGDRNHPRMKMAMIPRTAALIENTVSRAPGFRLGNVYVLAGIPSVAQAMFTSLKHELRRGPEILSASADVFLKESEIAMPLAQIAEANGDVEIGSYPFSRDGTYGANLVVRGVDAARVEAVIAEIVAAMQARGGSPQRIS